YDRGKLERVGLHPRTSLRGLFTAREPDGKRLRSQSADGGSAAATGFVPSLRQGPCTGSQVRRLRSVGQPHARPPGRIPRARRRERLLAGEDGLVQFAPAIALAGGRSDRGLTERDKHRGERCRRRVSPLPLEDRKLKSRQKRQAAFRAENAKSGDNRARRKRRDRETSQGSGADTVRLGLV